MQKYKIINISADDNLFSERLTNLEQVPKELYVKGEVNLLTKTPIVGIVGSRKVSLYGREVTDMLSRELAQRHIPVVSGLALGVDSVAHRAVIEARGQTIAVLPSGIESVYPASHRGLAMNIIENNGLLVSEYRGTMPALPHQFIARNRIIAALSDVLIIAEAAERSGSLHTARFALELGKTVMAVPGNITSATSAGTNRLIQSGATPILSIDDVFEALGMSPDDNEGEYYPENDAEKILLDLLKAGTTDSHRLLTKSNLAPEVFQTHLTMLEIKGVIGPSAGHWHIR